MALGKTVKALRDARGWTLKELSKRSGVPVGTIGALEVRDSVRSEYASKLAKGLGVALDQLIANDDRNLQNTLLENTSNTLTVPVQKAPVAINGEASLAQIMQGLAGYFEAMDTNTRKMAMGLIGQLADDPQDHARIAAMIDLSIHSKRPKSA